MNQKLIQKIFIGYSLGILTGLFLYANFFQSSSLASDARVEVKSEDDLEFEDFQEKSRLGYIRKKKIMRRFVGKKKNKTKLISVTNFLESQWNLFKENIFSKEKVRLPDVIISGVKKCGTVATDNFLCRVLIRLFY